MKTKRQRRRVGSRFQEGKAKRIWYQQTLLDHIFAAMQTSSLFLHSRDTQAGLSAQLHLGWQQEYSHLCTAGEGT